MGNGAGDHRRAGMGRRNAASATPGEIDMPRIGGTPEIVVEIIPSSAAPGGIGGLGTTVLAPAVANAIYRGQGKRMRDLPFEVL